MNSPICEVRITHLKQKCLRVLSSNLKPLHLLQSISVYDRKKSKVRACYKLLNGGERDLAYF